MSQTLYASFADASLAEKAAGALMDHGARAEDISIVAHGDYHNRRGVAGTAGNAAHAGVDRVEQAGDRSAAAVSGAVGATGTAARYDAAADVHSADAASRSAGTSAAGATDAGHTDAAAKAGISTTTPGDAGSGAAKGAEIGLGLGIAGALASLLIPGFGLVIGGGALAAAIGAAAGTTAAGAVAGGVMGYLKDQGVPDAVATDYHKAVEHGGALLTVQVPSGDLTATGIQEILAKYDASGVNTYGAAAA